MFSAVLDPGVADYFARFPAIIRDDLDRFRSLVFRIANETDGVGELIESLKWGEPSYTPARPRIGSSVRLAALDGDTIALHFICHTHLVERFRETYPEGMMFAGNRSILVRRGVAINDAALAHCVKMALTYHVSR